jgi:L-alanine-DL-glutamate epimerase-like enolase superfamily enzyme
MEQAIRPSFSVGQPLAKAAIDLACFDLAGRRAGVAAANLIGGARRTEFELSWTINATDMAAAEAQLEAGRARGYVSFNVKVGPPQTPEFDVELVRAVRRFSPHGFHWCDANTGYDLTTALEMAPKLADAGMAALESPLPPNQLRGYRRLTAQGAIPVYMDEGLITAVEAEEFAALGMFNGVTMKVARCGGLWPASGMAHMLQARGLGILASGLCDPDLSFAASLHLFAAIGLAAPLGLNGPQYLDESFAGQGHFMPRGSRVRLPEEPGLGVPMDEAATGLLSVAAER